MENKTVMERQNILFLLPHWSNFGDIILRDIQSILSYAESNNFVPKIWFASQAWDCKELNDVFQYSTGSTHLDYLKRVALTQNLQPENTIVCSYGSWQSTTKIGFGLKKLGFKWVHSPLGVNNCFSNHDFINYWSLLEKPMISQADYIRSIDLLEYNQLMDLHGAPNRVVFIPIASQPSNPDLISKMRDPIYVFCKMDPSATFNSQYLLIKAWTELVQKFDQRYELIFASNNLIQVDHWQHYLDQSLSASIGIRHIEDDSKEISWLEKSSFLISLSKQSKDFGQYIKSMSYGLIPVIMDHLFFRPLMDQEIGIKINPGRMGFMNSIRQMFQLNYGQMIAKQMRAAHYVDSYHSYDLIFNC